jgi:hypothetical protein
VAFAVVENSVFSELLIELRASCTVDAVSGDKMLVVLGPAPGGG